MAGQGAGPSRRSHTKSRKGCKTCKRRHIRCDETFPQCRNCTKHQVRCDYMENVGSDSDGQQSPEQPPLVFTPGTESRIDRWKQTGSFPYPSLQVFPPPQTHEYSKNELGLMHHLSAIADDLSSKGTSNFTLWTQKVPKFLSIASSYPYVMHALLSFSANNLAWSQSSDEIRNLHIQHGTIALRGLHEAIGGFSHANADAILAASLLLLWQATDWRSWASLRAGVQSVLSAMNSWKHESIFAEYIDDDDLFANPTQNNMQHAMVSSSNRMTILLNTIQALEHLQQSLSAHEAEAYWTGQLLSYMQRLQASGPASSPDEQYGHLYLLRKWLFWVPTLLLQRQGGQGPAMLTLAHFYATALALEPLYPDLGSGFCARIALAPLQAIIDVTSAMHSRDSHHSSAEMATLMSFPRHMAMHFRSRGQESHTAVSNKPSPSLDQFNSGNFDYASISNMSPAFAPSHLHLVAGQTPTLPSSYLEIPSSQAAGSVGFTLGTQQWGILPSPGFPPHGYTEHGQPYAYAMCGFRDGDDNNHVEGNRSNYQ